MENEGASLPGNRWRLTAPESYMLLFGPKSKGGALKLALLELVARGWLELTEVEEFGTFGRTRRIAVLRYGSGRGGSGGRPLDAVVELLGSLMSGTLEGSSSGDVPVADLARAALKRYGRLGGYAEAEVLPALMRRGLYERRERRFFGIFRSTGWEPTRAGEEARAELTQSMALGEERFGEWVDTDPARALDFLGAAGSSVLLMSPLHPDIQRLQERRRVEDSVGVYPVVAVGSDDDLETGTGGPFGVLDPGAFDSLGDAFSAIDSGVDSGGGGDGGGWGGDGGGGGGDGGGGGG